MLIKKIKPEISAFSYEGSSKELSLVSELKFFLNRESLKFQLDQNPYGDSNLIDVAEFTANDDFSELKFSSDYQGEMTDFQLLSNYDCDRTIFRLLATGVDGFSLTTENETDDLKIIFEKGQLKSLRLMKSVDFNVVDSLSILQESDGFQLVLFNPWRKFSLKSFVVKENLLISQTETAEEFSYKLDLQEFIVNLLKALTTKQ